MPTQGQSHIFWNLSDPYFEHAEQSYIIFYVLSQLVGPLNGTKVCTHLSKSLEMQMPMHIKYLLATGFDTHLFNLPETFRSVIDSS
jgi:hypothetical protein